MKKFTSSLLAALLVSVLAVGCDNKLNGNTPASPSSPASPASPASTAPSTQPSAPATPTNTVSCPTEGVTATPGSVVSTDFFCAFGPKEVKTGLKWVYETSTMAGSIETSVEFTKVTATDLTVVTNAAGKKVESVTKITEAGKPTVDGNANPSFTFLGYEDVTVKAGSYSQAAKLKVNSKDQASGAEMELTYWLAKGVGMVKVESKIKVSAPIAIDIPPVITQLKEFKS